MPYVSDAQRRFAHTDTAKKVGFPTAEFDSASKGQTNLPEHVKKQKDPKPEPFNPMRKSHWGGRK